MASVIPELIPHSESSNAIDLAHAIDPALGGIIVASGGVSAVSLLNAVSFGCMIFAIYRSS